LDFAQVGAAVPFASKVKGFAAALTHIITAPVFPDIPSLTEKYFSF
jgi:hypothetical protein